MSIRHLYTNLTNVIMKKKLLFACALALSSLGAMAQWTAPTPKLTTSADEIANIDSLIFYHVGQEMFLTAGTTWNTHACLTDDISSALLWEVQAQQSYSNCYKFYSPQASHNHYMFRDDYTNVYTDWQAQSTCLMFEFVDSDAGYLRIRSAADDPYYGINNLTEEDANYAYALWEMGWDPDNDDVDNSGNSLGSNIGVFMLDPDANSEYQLDWAVLANADYKLYLAQTNLYNRMLAGIAIGMDQSDLDPYASYITSTDLDAVNEAYATVDALVTEFAFNNAGEDNIVEVTSLINNPTIEGDRSSEPDGWIDTYGNMLIQNNKAYERYDAETGELSSEYGLDNFSQNWRSETDVSIEASDLHQVLSDLPEGRYTLQADCLGTTGSTENAVSGVSLYAISNGLTYSTPVNEGLLYGGSGLGYPQTYTVNIIHFGGDLTIGFGFVPGFARWVAVDNFKLFFAGGVDNPGFLALNNAIPQLQEYIDGFEDEIYIFSQDTYDAISAEVANANDILFAAVEDDCLAEVTVVNDWIDVVKAEVTAYTQLSTLITQVESDMESYENLLELSEQLSDMHDTYEDAFEDRVATIEQINEWVSAYDSFVLDYIKSILPTATADNPIEITVMGTDMAFNGTSFDGWTLDSDTGNGTEDGAAAEVWNSTFSCLQTLEDMPAGSYTLKAKAFYRTAGYETALTDYTNGTADVLTNLVVESSQAPVVNICEGMADEELADGYVELSNAKWMPNTMAAAEYAFGLEDSPYDCEVTGYLMNDGTLTFGIRNDGPIADDAWSIWSQFRLFYNGASTSDLYNVLLSKISEAASLQDEVGSAVAAANDMINAALTVADEVSETSAEEDIRAAIDELQAAIDYANESASLITSLMAAYETYSGKIGTIESTDTNFPTMLTSIESAIASEEFISNEQMEEWLNSLASAWTAYIQYDHLDATIDNPADISAVITNPSFDEGTNDTSGATGWTFTYAGDHIGWSNTTQQEGSDYAYEFWNVTSFEMHQIISGLAEGYYHLTVNALYRAGNNSDAVAAAFFEDPDNARDLIFYANTKNVPVACAYEAGLEEDTYETSASYTYDGVTRYVPNTMITANSYFKAGYYNNELDVYLAEGEDLTIGLNLVGNIVTYNWSVFDDFTISYLGNGDENMPEAVESVEAAADAANAAIYDLSGRKVSKPQKGIYIVNGKKVVIK